MSSVIVKIGFCAFDGSRFCHKLFCLDSKEIQFSGLELRITELLSPIGVSLETSSALHYRSPFQNQRFSILRRQASVTNAQSFTLYFNSKRGKMIHINDGK